MLPTERDQVIVRLLRTSGVASATDLAARLGVSHATIRRDLQRLDRHGELRRVYGGAVLDQPAEMPFAVRQTVGLEVKTAVAALAAGLVADGEVVLLDIGTTTMELARLLRGRDVTVVTNSLAVYDVLRDDPQVQLVLLGWMVRRNYRSLVGTLTEAALAEVSVDRLFLSCTGVRSDGSVVDNMMVEVPAKRAMVRTAESVVLLAPARKFPGTGSLRICSLVDVHVIVTDDEPGGGEALDAFRAGGGTVLTPCG